MGKVGIIGVGQSAFVRGYPGSIRELALKDSRRPYRTLKFQIRILMRRLFVQPRNMTNRDPLPVSLRNTWGSRRSPPVTWRACVLPAAWG